MRDAALGKTRAFNGGFFTQRRLRRILELAGYPVSLGWPKSDDHVAIWGNSPTAHRGLRMVDKTGAKPLFVEDAFLRSLFPARIKGEDSVGLLIDHTANHFDPTTISDLEKLLKSDPLDNGHDLQRARDAIARISAAKLSKYCAYQDDPQKPRGAYILILDQTRDDAAVRASGGNDALFSEMLYYAQENHPGHRIVIKTHPETNAGQRTGYYTDAHCSSPYITLYDGPASAWEMLENAVAVYTVSSTMGFEAILAGHKPHVFGKPFYAGWGLTQDYFPIDRRQRTLTRAQLFVSAMIKYPTWYDPITDALCPLETVLDALEAKSRAYQQDAKGWNAQNIRLWKRAHFKRIFGAYGGITYNGDDPQRSTMTWGAQGTTNTDFRVEDGFVRSRGLGAELVPALSLCLDQRGIYYDPTRASDLESLLQNGRELRRDQLIRVEKLIARLIKNNISKYNLTGTASDLPQGYRILVPGQVEDDASIELGADEVRTNLDLLRNVRANHPDAIILYKPHPDVIAGLRKGHIDPETALEFCDQILENANIADLLYQVDGIHTITSLTGFEAFLRGRDVTTYGAPFYAGWGLTTDLGKTPARRQRQITVEELVHRTLIDYPRYWDPVTKSITTVEGILHRLETDGLPRPAPFYRMLSKVQGLFASADPFWR